MSNFSLSSLFYVSTEYSAVYWAALRDDCNGYLIATMWYRALRAHAFWALRRARIYLLEHEDYESSVYRRTNKTGCAYRKYCEKSLPGTSDF